MSKQINAFIGDVKINDFANLPGSGTKIRKSVRELNFTYFEEDETSAHNSKSRRKRNKQIIEDPNRLYNDYHIDIWFLISEHILPDDIGRFALICQKTNYVVSSAKFWYNFYYRFYSSKETLPLRLQPECMVRLGGLRSCVIRTLFYTYEPFVQKLKIPFDINSLQGLECVGAWYKQTKHGWVYCFRFRKKLTQHYSVRLYKNDYRKQNLITTLRDVHMNTEEGCKLLVVNTTRFSPIPLFFGMQVFLASITRPLCQNLLENKVKMIFSNYCNETVATITYDPVQQCRVFPWWHPEYYSFYG